MKQVKKKLHAEWEVISSAEWLEKLGRNPTNEEMKKSSLELVYAGIADKVIMIEHGVMFSSKPEDMSPAVMTEDYLKKQRKIVKKEANYNLTEGDKVKGKIQNIMQDNIKLLMNRMMFHTLEKVCARFSLIAGNC